MKHYSIYLSQRLPQEGYLLSPLLFSVKLGLLNNVFRKRSRGIRIEKNEEIKLSVFAMDEIIFLENPKELIIKLS